MTVRAHFTHQPDELEALTTLLDPEISLSFGDELPPDGAEVVVSGRPAEEMVRQAQIVIIPWAGVPEKTLELVRAHPRVHLHNLHHNAPQVAELAVALLYAAAKRIVPYDRALRQGDWRPRYEPARAVLLNGKTAVVLGYGAIGRHIAQILYGIGMKVIGVNRSGAGDPGRADSVFPVGRLQEVLPQAEALMVSLPLTDETRGLLDAEALQLLPEGSLISNIGRGAIIDQWALFHALQSGHLGGAGLDVWWNYPTDADARASTYPSDAPLHELDNVVMSPHRGGSVVERTAGWSAALAKLLNACARGEEVPNRVDVEKGY